MSVRDNHVVSFRNDIEQWMDSSFWKELCPLLSISFDNDKKAAANGGSNDLDEWRRCCLVQDGYALVDDDQSSDTLTSKLKTSIAALHKKGIPATFVLLFDETWDLAEIASRVLAGATHPNNVFNFDVLAWHIDPKEDAAGFSPHRDRQPKDVLSSFHPDQQAKYVTMWMALSRATPENSCLYVIPRQYDPGYTKGDVDNELDGQDPLSRALTTKQSYQNIRALPCRPGQAVLFTHRILHWGSKGNPSSSLPNEPRIAVSFVTSDPRFEKPYLVAKDTPPPFRIRLLLVCAQLLVYHERFELPKDCIRTCYDYCKKHANELEPTYRQKVMLEFVKAMKEETNNDSHHKNQKVKLPKSDDDDDDDDDDEAVLEEMLEAEAGGYGEFEDDFDRMENGDKNGSTFGNGKGDVEDDDDDEGGVSLFGSKPPDPKRRKVG